MFALILTACALMSAEEALVFSGPVELVSDAYRFTEGPLWLPEGRWIFSDVQGDTIYYGDGSVYRKPSNKANGLALDTEGRLIACEEGRLTRTETDGTRTVLAESYNGKPLNTPNDVAVRSDGTIFFTDPKSLRPSMALALGYDGVIAIPAGDSVFLTDPKSAGKYSGVYALPSGGGELKLIADDLKYPNGIALSPDEKVLYISDTSAGHIRAFDLAADGSLSNGRVHSEVRIPDGIAVDVDGRIWSSSSRGIAIFGVDGAPVGSVDFKGMPTNCAFGGADGSTLLITVRKMLYKVDCIRPGLPAGRN